MGDQNAQLQDNDVIEEETQQLEEVPAPEETEQETEESAEDTVEIVLEGEQETAPAAGKPPKRATVRHMRERIKELNRDTKDKSKEINALQARIDELEERLASAAQSQTSPVPTNAQGAPRRPTLSDYDYDTDRYEAAFAEWVIDRTTAAQDQRQAQAATTQQAESRIAQHYERANKLNVLDYEQAEDATIQVLGAEFVQSIQATIPDSEKVLYFLGKNPEKLHYFHNLFASEPGRATFELGQMSTKLTLVPKRKTPPDPDIPIKGGGGHAGNPKYQKYLKELQGVYGSGKPGALQAARDIRKRAMAEGVELPLNPLE